MYFIIPYSLKFVYLTHPTFFAILVIILYFSDDGYFVFLSLHLFKMDWLIMSIVLLCIMAMGLYAVIGVVEKLYEERF